MSDYGKLPRGIRNNNPGNLRHWIGGDRTYPLADGFVVFPDATTGIAHLIKLERDYYSRQGIKTVTDFVAHYAPSSENDTHMYITALMKRCGWEKQDPKTWDLFLHVEGRQIVLAKAIVSIENGLPPKTWPHYPAWYGESVFMAALHGVNIGAV